MRVDKNGTIWLSKRDCVEQGRKAAKALGYRTMRDAYRDLDAGKLDNGTQAEVDLRSARHLYPEILSHGRKRN